VLLEAEVREFSKHCVRLAWSRLCVCVCFIQMKHTPENKSGVCFIWMKHTPGSKIIKNEEHPGLFFIKKKGKMKQTLGEGDKNSKKKKIWSRPGIKNHKKMKHTRTFFHQKWSRVSRQSQQSQQTSSLDSSVRKLSFRKFGTVLSVLFSIIFLFWSSPMNKKKRLRWPILWNVSKTHTQSRVYNYRPATISHF